MAAVEQYGRYELRGLLGEGGFAEVFRAYDPALGREVALKRLLPWLARSDETRRRFLAETQAIAPLRHPNIVTIYDVGEADGTPFFTMELIEGETLAQAIAARGAFSLEEARRIVAALASALDYLHGAGLVHRDIKGANVMLSGGGRVVLMDFGIARNLDNTFHTRTGASLGTPEAMAPEQVRGEPVGYAADIYALGILAFQLLAGRPPFQGDTAFVLHAQAFEPPPPLAQFCPGLPSGVYSAVAAALQKDPAQRPASATAFATMLHGSDSGVRTGQLHDIPDATGGTAKRPTKRARVFVLALAGVTLSLCLVAVFVVLGARQSRPTRRTADSRTAPTQPSAVSVLAATASPAMIPVTTPPTVPIIATPEANDTTDAINAMGWHYGLLFNSPVSLSMPVGTQFTFCGAIDNLKSNADLPPYLQIIVSYQWGDPNIGQYDEDQGDIHNIVDYTDKACKDVTVHGPTGKQAVKMRAYCCPNPVTRLRSPIGGREFDFTATQ